MSAAGNPDLPGPSGPRVRFRVGDVFVPETDAIRGALDAEWELTGILVGLSDSGDRPGEYGIVRVAAGVNMVVPVICLTEVCDGASTNE